MDFFGLFEKMPWTATLTGPFLIELFSNFKDDQDVYGFVKSNMVVLAASVYAKNPDEFNVFESEDFLWFLKKYSKSNNEQEKAATCDCLYFLFKQKQCLVDFFAANPQNLEILKSWLKISFEKDLKTVFMASLRELLEPSENSQ